MLKRFLLLLVLFSCISVSVFAGSTGKLVGKVKDENGKPLAYAAVMLEGTSLGATTKENGSFIIINIPPGTYNVVCQMMSYKSVKLTNVVINVDETTKKNFTLTKVGVDIEEFTIIENKEKMVKRDKVSSAQKMSDETIEEMPVETLDEAIATQPGVSNIGGQIRVRGGRAGEVQYTVDGMSVSDPVDGGASLSLDTDAIQVMDVMTGGFTAEYGNAQSGVVNIVTKDGGKDYSGKIEFNSDHFFEDASNSDVFKFAIGGPVLGGFADHMRDKFTFFLNGAANWSDSRFKEYYVSDPNDELLYVVSEYEKFDPYEGRDDFIGFDIGDRNFNNYNANIKFKYEINPLQKITVALRGDNSDSKFYSHFWKYALDHFAKDQQEQRQIVATYDHTFAGSKNLKVKASYFSKQWEQSPDGISIDDFYKMDPNFDQNTFYGADPNELDGVITIDRNQNGILDEYEVNMFWEYDIAGEPESRNINDFNQPGSIYDQYIDDKTETYTLRSDFEYVINEIHQAKTGVEIIKYHINKDRLSSPWNIDETRYTDYLKGVEADDTVFDEIDSTYTNLYNLQKRYDAIRVAMGFSDGYEADPWQGAFYIQDKMDYEGMIINAGLRFDLWYLGGDYDIKTANYTGSYMDLLNPDSDYNVANADTSVADDPLIQAQYESDKAYYKKIKDKFEKPRILISPRFGISHPVSERDVVHFAYNYQNQIPQMQYIFTTARPQDAITNPGQNIIIGNPELDPQITMTYEVGLSHQISENYAMDLTAYYKNTYNYVSTHRVYDEDDANVSWLEYISEDYGSARGLDMFIRKNRSNFISGSVSYSLAWANGNNSNTVVQDLNTNLREFPLDWDTRHSFSFNGEFKVGDNEEWYIPFSTIKFPMDDFSINVLYSLSSGTPYTPINEEDRVLDTNSETQGLTSETDVNFSKSFSFTEKMKLRFYCRVNNIFNRKNELNVYSKTGSPYYDGADLSESNNSDYTFPEVQYIHDYATNSPANVTSGRTITMGFTFNW